ncbi:MAG: zf-HC2 domain-containing protein [Candidatus Omnitrophica bacterium]|nr:zf-HC2 domain-containing protein [Candidatus Omnitrophota bacterium]
MKCEQIRKSLVAYLDGEVTPAKRSIIELHLSTCQRCREELDALKKVQAELRQALNTEAETVSPVPGLWEKMQKRIEATASPSFWEKHGAWLNRPLWRAVIPVVLVVVLAVGVLWGTGILPQFGGMAPPPAPAPAPIVPAPTVPPVPTPTPVPPTTIPVPRPAPPPPFEARAVPEEAHYLPGQPVQVKLSLTNVSSDPIILDAYPPEIRITPRININFTPIVFSVAGGTQPRELKQNETVSVDFTWDQKDKAGSQVQPGWYNVIFGEITVRQGNSRYTFNPGAYVLIQYPQGAMEKSFDLNQSQTMNGITVTLERVELTADGSSFYFFFIPPGYTPPPTGPGLSLMPPTMSVMAKAEYSVSGITKYAGTAGFNTKGNGLKLVWGSGPGKLDTVPSDAKGMTFTIIQINDWAGPWEFKIPLQ